VTCPICGEKGGACHGSVPVLLTPDQLKDIGLKPEDIKPGGTIQMADQEEPKARYPKVDPDTLPKGAEHGYIGAVEVYDPANPGHSNVVVGKPAKGSSKPVVGQTGTIKSDDVADLGGETTDNVAAPKR
jgi:hypothetical protein